jgi:myo-inositol-1(or 4)-monophosphatase
LPKKTLAKLLAPLKKEDNNQVLTETDLAIGKCIVEQIQLQYPTHNVIDEEAGVIDKKSQFTWVVDPIDGTSNFANGLPTYGLMMGLLDGATAIAGGIMLPAFDQLYVAQKGQGAFCNDQPIHVTLEPKLLSSLVAYGIDGHQEDPARTHKEAAVLAEIILCIRNLRTTNSAYDMAQVPAGRYGAFLNQTTKIWDNVAVQPIVEEAGGIVTDFWGKTMDYSNPLQKATQNFTICAGSPALHQALQEIIHNHA